MDIVERAVELLGTPAETPGPLTREVRDPAGADPILRAASALESQWSLSGGQTPAPDAAQGANAVGEARSRTVSIDMRRLRAHRMVTPDEERTPMTESFRRVKRHLLANVSNPKAGLGRNLVMITSSLPGEGKTFCSINLAISLAMEIDRTVLLVDADIAKPSVAAVLGIEPEQSRGFMDVLLDPTIALSDVMYKTDIGNLSILPAGRPNGRATEVLARDAAKNVLHEMAARYEDRIIIFDSAPLLAASEASVLASHMGQVVVVVEAGRTTERLLKEALSRIETCNVAGVLLNKGAMPSEALGGYGYGYGYGYKYGDRRGA